MIRYMFREIRISSKKDAYSKRFSLNRYLTKLNKEILRARGIFFKFKLKNEIILCYFSSELTFKLFKYLLE